MQIKLDFPTYNAPIYLRTESLERKKRSNLVRHLRRKASVRQYNDAGMISPQFNLRAEHVLIYNTRISTNKRMICGSGSDLAEWLERLTANAVVDTLESEG